MASRTIPIVCATYGFFENPFLVGEDEWGIELPPLNDAENAERMRAWMRDQHGRARITGRNARNLNPLILGDRSERRLEFGWWWLHVGNAPAKFSAFNARAETLSVKWRAALRRRALAPATWFDEKGHRFSLDGDAFGIASVTTTANLPDGSSMLSYALVTRASTGAVHPVHHRMPLVLPLELHDAWLDPEREWDARQIASAVSDSEQISRAFQLVPHEEPEDTQPTLF